MPVLDQPAADWWWWDQWYGGQWPTSSPGAGEPTPAFPDAPLAISVTIYVDSSWIDITPFVYRRARIELTRGKPNESGQVDPARARMELNNRDGQFSPRNPTSWLYGKIGRNTQVRVAVGADIRFVGEISEWPPRWDTTGTDVYVPVEASGVLRRIQQGNTPLKSTLYRGLTSDTAGLVAYWPCEDGADATAIASAVGGSPMAIVGSPDLAASTVFKCSAPLPLMASSKWTGQVLTHKPSDAVQFSLLLSLPAAGSTNDQNLISFESIGLLHLVDLVYHTGGDLELRVLNDSDVQVLNTVHNTNLNGHNVRVVITFETSGLDVDWSLDVYEVDASTFSASGTLAGLPLPNLHRVAVNNVAAHDQVAIGHITVTSSATRSQVTLADELAAYDGEAAGRRVERLCDEEGVSFRSVGDLDSTAAMGPQLPGKLVDLLRDAEAADGGILHEPRDAFGLAYRTRASLYGQAAALELDYSAAHLSGIEPVDDDQQVRNDVTVTRTDGSSARVVEESGPLSVQAPPAGVGRYDEQVTLNLEGDSTLADRAGWLVHLGTVDEARYPTLAVNLAREPFVADAALTAAARVLDIGDRVTVANPPAWLPPDTISQLAQGFTETLAQFTHTIAINCSPESPWGAVGAYDDGVIRYASSDTTLAEDLDTTETAIDVAVVGPLWTTDTAEMPFNIRVGGEVMTVTAVAGASSPQTFTVTRSVNGVVKAHTSGATVDLDPTRVYAL